MTDRLRGTLRRRQTENLVFVVTAVAVIAVTVAARQGAHEARRNS